MMVVLPLCDLFLFVILYLHLRNRKHFPRFHTVIETRVEVWENEKLKWEREPVMRVFQFHAISSFPKLPRVFLQGNIYIYIFYKITRRKLKCGNAPFLSKRKFFIPFMMTCAVAYHGVNFPCFLYSFSKNLLVYYCKCCNLIGYATRYLFVNRYRVAASNATRPSFSQKNNAFSSFFEIILKK